MIYIGVYILLFLCFFFYYSEYFVYIVQRKVSVAVDIILRVFCVCVTAVLSDAYSALYDIDKIADIGVTSVYLRRDNPDSNSAVPFCLM